ncbi:replication factor C large subunit [Candidatus Bathyarchaeota archaeon]|nr:replication factor C large subunit [Candidatus Bathyarchaeota archaeon]
MAEQPWTERFRPRTLREVVGNEEAKDRFLEWLRSWEDGIPEKRAVLLYGPPGVGKTSLVVAAANDLGYDLLEVNASDYRTAKRLKEILGRASTQQVTVTGRRRLILIDELEGLSGREDRGGVEAILDLIRETRAPIILVATVYTSLREAWERKLRELMKLSLPIELRPIPVVEVIERLREIASRVGVEVEEEVLEELAIRSEGDLRTAINDLEAVARGRRRITLQDLEALGLRDRQLYAEEALRRLFTAKTLQEAKGIISSTQLNYDELIDWIYENIPYILDDPRELSEALEALARADIHKARAERSQAYRLLKYMFDELAGGVALSLERSQGLLGVVERHLRAMGIPLSLLKLEERPEGVSIAPVRYLGGDTWRRVNMAVRSLGGSWDREGRRWIVGYLRPPRIALRYWWSREKRRMLKSISSKVASRMHISTSRAVRDVIPILKVIFQSDPEMAEGIAEWMELDGDEVKWLSKG